MEKHLSSCLPSCLSYRLCPPDRDLSEVSLRKQPPSPQVRESDWQEGHRETPWKHTNVIIMMSPSALAFCVNSQQFVFKAEMLHSVWITIGRELANCSSSIYASSPVWMGLLLTTVSSLCRSSTSPMGKVSPARMSSKTEFSLLETSTRETCPSSSVRPSSVTTGPSSAMSRTRRTLQEHRPEPSSGSSSEVSWCVFIIIITGDD